MTHQPTCPDRTCKQKESGFTLIELLVALTVTVIGLAGLLSLHMATIKGNQMASRSAEAATIAQRTVEELRAMSIEKIITDHGALPITNAILDPAPGRAEMTYSRRFSARELTSLSEDLVLLRVEIFWTDDGADPNSVDERLHHDLAVEIIRTRQEAL